MRGILTYMKKVVLTFCTLVLLMPMVAHGASISIKTRALLLFLLQRISNIHPVTTPIVEPTRLPSVITQVNPLRGRSSSEITLIGTGFSASNTVHTIFGSHYGLPSQRGRTEIKFIYRYPPVVQTPDEALTILSQWGITPTLVDESVAQIPPENFSQEVLIYVENEYGSSNVVTFIEEL
mgnify:CR=1 FL=1